MVERSTHWLTALMLLALAGLGTVIALELSGSFARAPEVTAAALASAAAKPTLGDMEFRPPPQPQFDEISDRPLFFPSRRPFISPVAAESEAPRTADLPSIELVGLLLTGRGRAALIQPEGQAGAHWVHERQTVAGWLVEEIAADRVRLRGGDRVEIVKLRADRARSRLKLKRASASRKDAKAANGEQMQTTPVR
jgi:hypothetical protein